MTMGRPWSPRYLVIDHGSSWSTVKYHGDDHGRPRSTMVKLQMIMVDHGQIVCDRGRPWSSHMTMFYMYYS